ncbi:hypothetical protein GCM10011393_10160 [Sphingopyxis bauzanensis]|nr:hypothetical protein GCM10011393_10160 [Sphingopyxis bauzanensis]
MTGAAGWRGSRTIKAPELARGIGQAKRTDPRPRLSKRRVRRGKSIARLRWTMMHSLGLPVFNVCTGAKLLARAGNEGPAIE